MTIKRAMIYHQKEYKTSAMHASHRVIDMQPYQPMK